MNERQQAQQEADDANAATSAALGRPLVILRLPTGDVDITEKVVSVVEALWTSLDWGSGFLGDDEERDATYLLTALRFECREFWWPRDSPPYAGPHHCELLYGHEGDHRTGDERFPRSDTDRSG